MKNIERYFVFAILAVLFFIAGFSTYRYISHGEYNSLSTERESDCVMIYNVLLTLEEENKRLKKQLNDQE